MIIDYTIELPHWRYIMKRLLIILLAACSLTSYATASAVTQKCAEIHHQKMSLRAEEANIDAQLKQLALSETPDQGQINDLKIKKSNIKAEYKALHDTPCTGKSHVHRHDRRL